jgi:hypothetical protein
MWVHVPLDGPYTMRGPLSAALRVESMPATYKPTRDQNLAHQPSAVGIKYPVRAARAFYCGGSIDLARPRAGIAVLVVRKK